MVMRTLVVGLACVAGAAALRPQPLGRPPVGRPVGRRGEPLRVLADDRIVARGSDELDVVDPGGDEQVAARGGDGLDAETWAAAAQFAGKWKAVAVDDMAALEKLSDEKRVPLYFRKVLRHTLANGGVFEHHLDAEGRYSESEESDCFFFDQSTAPALVNGPPVLDRAPGGEPVRRTVSCRDGRLRILEEPRVAAPRARAAGVMEHVLSLEGDTLRRRLTNKDTGTSVVWTMVRVERAASLRKTTLTTSHDDAAVLARFPAAQRPLLTATGNLQKILASFHNDEVWVRVDANDEVAPRIYERRVTIGIGARVCVHASSVVFAHSLIAQELISSGRIGIGQTYHKLGILPRFDLVDAAADDSTFRRTYTLSSPHVTCHIRELFPQRVCEPDFFDDEAGQAAFLAAAARAAAAPLRYGAGLDGAR